MTKRILGLGVLAALSALGALSWPAQAEARSSYYSNQCASCHGSSASTCNGCHAHGAHSSSAKSDMNVAATTSKSSYAPGETVTVTVRGGYLSGRARGVLFDQSSAEIARTPAGGAAFPVTLTARAPTTPGTYRWSAAWYGHRNDASGARFGTGWKVDASRANHGWEVVAIAPFTVTSGTTPGPGPVAGTGISVSASSLAFGSVAVGGGRSTSLTVANRGSGALAVTVAPGSNTSGEFRCSPTSFSLAAGGRKMVFGTYRPTAAGSDAGTLVVRSNDAATPSISVALSGTGVASAYPGCTPTSAGHTSNTSCASCHSSNPCTSGGGTGAYPGCVAPSSGHTSNTNCASCHSSNPCGSSGGTGTYPGCSAPREDHTSNTNCASCHSSNPCGSGGSDDD